MNVRRAAVAGSCLAIFMLCATARVEAGCSISTTPVSFGTYDVFSSVPLDSTGSVTFNCTKKEDIEIELNKGGASTFALRRMLSGSETLYYNLYLDAARTIIWGNGNEGTQVYEQEDVPKDTNITVVIYGRIPAGQDVAAGAYTNTVTATLNF